MKKALITGITGQDGSYLAEHLLELGYEVHGLTRSRDAHRHEQRFWRINPIIDKIKLHSATFEDYLGVYKIVHDVRPDECYHLAAQSFVGYSLESEFSTLNANISCAHFILAALKSSAPDCRFFFAGSSEMFGSADESPQNERTRFHPRSVYGISKVAGYELTRSYRESHHLHASTGFLYNHESPRRGHEFVTRKITSHAAKIRAGILKELRLGATDARRDWGHAKEYVAAMHLMLQQENPDDYVIASGTTHTVQEFADLAFQAAGLDPKQYIKIDSSLFRPPEPVARVGDISKARRVLGWEPKIPFEKLVAEMVESDLRFLGVESKKLESA